MYVNIYLVLLIIATDFCSLSVLPFMLGTTVNGVVNVMHDAEDGDDDQDDHGKNNGIHNKNDGKRYSALKTNDVTDTAVVAGTADDTMTITQSHSLHRDEDLEAAVACKYLLNYMFVSYPSLSAPKHTNTHTCICNPLMFYINHVSSDPNTISATNGFLIIGILHSSKEKSSFKFV